MFPGQDAPPQVPAVHHPAPAHLAGLPEQRAWGQVAQHLLEQLVRQSVLVQHLLEFAVRSGDPGGQAPRGPQVVLARPGCRCWRSVSRRQSVHDLQPPPVTPLPATRLSSPHPLNPISRLPALSSSSQTPPIPSILPYLHHSPRQPARSGAAQSPD